MILTVALDIQIYTLTSDFEFPPWKKTKQKETYKLLLLEGEHI